MRVRILVVTALVCGVAIAGCSRAPEPVPLPAPAVPVPVPTEDGLAPFYEQAIEWRDCGDAECARIDVPLDYLNLDGRTTELSLTRVPAADEPIGALFVNPGGPGGSAFDYARAADYIVSPSIRDAFDIIGVDPRGVAGSDPIRCWSDT
ncbi:MAG: proteinase, partial [Micrococcales bacterium]|nr:proteinase [Micrococcales bacterium]